MNKQDQRSELQERIAAELREKALKSNLRDETSLKSVEDFAYMNGTKQTTTLSWAWIVIILFAAGIFVSFIVQGSK